MSTFLDDLERELLAAHPRRRSARRRATAGRIAATAPVVLVVLLTLAGAGAFLLSVRGEDAARPVATSPEPPPAAFAADLPAEGVAVLNGTTVAGLGGKVSDLIGAGGPNRPRDEVGNAPTGEVTRTRVAFAEGHREAARRVAFRLGGIARPLDAKLRAAAPEGAALVVVVGRDLLRVRSGTLRPPGEGGVARGNAGIVERSGPDVVSVDAFVTPAPNYAIWLLTERGDATLVGFAADPVRAQRRLHGTREIRVPAGTRKLIVTREKNPQPRRPARALLEATLR